MFFFDQLRKSDPALRAVAWGVVGGLGVLLFGLWRVQVYSREHYQESARSQSFRTVRVPAMRGRILDRNGRSLADNTPRYRIDVYLDELRRQFDEEYQQRRLALLASRGKPASARTSWLDQVADRFRRRSKAPLISSADREAMQRQSRYAVVSNLVAQAGTRFGIQLQVNETALHRHWTEKRALPMTILDQLTPGQVALVTEQGWSLPGVALESQPIRNYPNGTVAAHLLGHLQRADDDELDEGRFDYRLRDYRGVAGIEGALDHQLRGAAGARTILVNSAGYRHRQAERMLIEPETGQTVVTTIDLELQRLAEQTLAVRGPETRGAVVVMDPNTGDILAMVSAPTFSPARFLDGLTQEDVNQLYDVRLRPAVNRATAGIYQPGSTFKIVTALALLEGGVLTPETIHDKMMVHDNYYIGKRRIGDTAPVGEYDFRRAFIRSSNGYFIDHARRLGLRKLLEMGARFHLGERTGLKIAEESAGIFPRFEDVQELWSEGNLANVSIGQEIAVTPLQLAQVVSAVANGGRIYWPRLVDRVEASEDASRERPIAVKTGQLRGELGVRPAHLEIVRAAMRDDVSDKEGSGREAAVPGFAVCGKTGTAEVKQGTRQVDKITWFVSFAPYEAPRYVVVVMVESGNFGGTTCAPVAGKIYKFLRERELRTRAEVATQ